VGSYLFPGYKNFAITPATNPIIIVQRMLIAFSPVSGAQLAPDKDDFQLPKAKVLLEAKMLGALTQS
jgi:hypothetical protein